ncbi:hypothetical protein WKG93_24035, partial [Pantoea agglomerans]|uniref:hypothetical protein n=1 Tax=Enterobacter agglomerans TaxID=549 RepID=UPI003C7AF763
TRVMRLKAGELPDNRSLTIKTGRTLLRPFLYLHFDRHICQHLYIRACPQGHRKGYAAAPVG